MKADDKVYPLGFGSRGLTVRDHIAIQAMQGMLANQAMIDVHNTTSQDWISTHAYEQADSMIAQSRKVT